MKKHYGWGNDIDSHYGNGIIALIHFFWENLGCHTCTKYMSINQVSGKDFYHKGSIP